MILKITLRPLDKFFFGGEGSFKENASSDDSRRSTYLLHSRYYPQQTGVLGLLRNQLLLQNGLLANNAARMDASSRRQAKVLIGKQNFVKEKVEDFGVIQRLSPLFLWGEDGAICPPAPLDDRLIPDPDNDAIAHPLEFVLDTFQENTWPLLKNYREKEGLFPQLQHPIQGNTALKDVFLPKERVGITKAARPWGDPVGKKDDEEGYYYQTYLQFLPKRKEVEHDPNKAIPAFLVKGYVFYVALNVEINDEESGVSFTWTDGPAGPGAFTLGPALVEFGGERSVFQMEVEKHADDAFPEFTTSYLHARVDSRLQGQVKRLICLSPAYVDDVSALRQDSYLIVSEMLSFRFLSTSIENTEHYQQINRYGPNANKDAPTESNLYHLLDRGSVVYFDQKKEKSIRTLFDKPDFQKIGYNQYHIL